MQANLTIEDRKHNKRYHDWFSNRLGEAGNQHDAGSCCNGCKERNAEMQTDKHWVCFVQDRNLESEVIVGSPEDHAVCEEAPERNGKVAVLLEQVVVYQAIFLEEGLVDDETDEDAEPDDQWCENMSIRPGIWVVAP